MAGLLDMANGALQQAGGIDGLKSKFNEAGGIDGLKSKFNEAGGMDALKNVAGQLQNGQGFDPTQLANGIPGAIGIAQGQGGTDNPQATATEVMEKNLPEIVKEALEDDSAKDAIQTSIISAVAPAIKDILANVEYLNHLKEANVKEGIEKALTEYILDYNDETKRSKANENFFKTLKNINDNIIGNLTEFKKTLDAIDANPLLTTNPSDTRPRGSVAGQTDVLLSGIDSEKIKNIGNNQNNSESAAPVDTDQKNGNNTTSTASGTSNPLLSMANNPELQKKMMEMGGEFLSNLKNDDKIQPPIPPTDTQTPPTGEITPPTPPPTTDKQDGGKKRTRRPRNRLRKTSKTKGSRRNNT